MSPPRKPALRTCNRLVAPLALTALFGLLSTNQGLAASGDRPCQPELDQLTAITEWMAKLPGALDDVFEVHQKDLGIEYVAISEWIKGTPATAQSTTVLNAIPAEMQQLETFRTGLKSKLESTHQQLLDASANLSRCLGN